MKTYTKPISFEKQYDSDIVKPPTPKKDKERRRKIGALPGHKQHLRTPIALELIDEIVKLELTNCPDCQQLDLVDSETKIFQQITLVEKPIVVTEYQQLMYWCKNCQCSYYVRLPEAVEKAGLFGEDMVQTYKAGITSPLALSKRLCLISKASPLLSIRTEPSPIDPLYGAGGN